MLHKLSLILLTAFAAWHDVNTRRIPNSLTLAGCLLGLTINTAQDGQHGLINSLLGLLTGLVLYLPLWLLNARGAGDVKLLAAAGSFLGPHNTLLLALTAAIVGGILALALVIAKGASLQTATNILSILRDLIKFRRPTHTLASPRALRLPHALVIFVSAVILVAIRNG